MFINSVGMQTFGRSEAYNDVLLGRQSFYSLDEYEKLDVIYDKLVSLEKDHKGLSMNQKKINDFNRHAFDCIVSSSSKNSNSADIAMENINYQYNRNHIDIVG